MNIGKNAIEAVSTNAETGNFYTFNIILKQEIQNSQQFQMSAGFSSHQQ